MFEINYCRKCGNRIYDNKKICQSCGFDPLNGYDFCQQCGFESKQGQKLCTNCGFDLKNNPITIDIEKSSPKIRIAILSIIAIIILAFSINNQIKSQRIDAYKDLLGDTVYLMKNNSQLCSEIIDITSITWKNAIYGVYDQYNQGWYGFQDSLNFLYSDSTILYKLEIITDKDKIIVENMKELQNPPEECIDLFEEFHVLYDTYQSIVIQANYPTGSYNTFTETANNNVSEFIKEYKIIQVKLPIND